MVESQQMVMALGMLKKQFEAAAIDYHRLSHLLVEAPSDQRDVLKGPFPVNGCRSWDEAIGTHHSGSMLTFRIKDHLGNGTRIGRLEGIRALQSSGYHLSGYDRPTEVLRKYYEGRDYFKKLAERAGQMLELLPAEIINAYPADWKPLEVYLRSYSLLGENEPADPSKAVTYFNYDAILPPGENPGDRWISFLYWLAWRGDVPGVMAERQTWVNSTTFPWQPTKEDYDKSTKTFPFTTNYPFDNTRHFFSVIDNLFLCSALAINAIEGQLESIKMNDPSKTNVVANSGQSSVAEVATQFKRDKVFISYSHKDKMLMEELLVHLSTLRRSGKITEWSDKQILPGSQWFDEIKTALASTKIAVLLVSKDFLASDFIHEHELGPLLKEADAGGVRILWILIRDCLYSETPLERFQALVSPPKKAFALLGKARDSAWTQACEAIKEAAKQP